MTMPHLMNCEHQAEGWCLDCVGKLQAECEALRKDAERFRWLRSHPDAVCVTVSIHGDWIPAISEQLDAALDAMGKEKA